MSNTTQKGKTRGSWIAAAVLAMAAIAYAVFYFVPRMRSIAGTLAELNSKQTFVLEAQKARRLREQLEHELQDTLAYNEKYSPQLLHPRAVSALYGDISQIAKSHDVTTPKFEPQPAIELESVHKIVIGLGVSGPFHSIHHVLRDLEALPARIWVDDIKFRGPRENGKPVECDMTLVVFIDNPEKSD